MTHSKLIAVRKPNKEEKARGAEIVFERKKGKEVHTIFACKCYESWEQWGAIREILVDNIDDVQNWRDGKGVII